MLGNNSLASVEISNFFCCILSLAYVDHVLDGYLKLDLFMVHAQRYGNFEDADLRVAMALPIGY